MGTYVQTVDGNHVEEAYEQLIPHQDCAQEVAQYQGTKVVFCVRESTQGSHDDTSQVEQSDECEESSIHVEPQYEQNSSTDFPGCFRGGFFDIGLEICGVGGFRPLWELQ
jgi:hypothetical protein